MFVEGSETDWESAIYSQRLAADHSRTPHKHLQPKLSRQYDERRGEIIQVCLQQTADV